MSTANGVAAIRAGAVANCVLLMVEARATWAAASASLRTWALPVIFTLVAVILNIVTVIRLITIRKIRVMTSVAPPWRRGAWTGARMAYFSLVPATFCSFAVVTNSLRLYLSL